MNKFVVALRFVFVTSCLLLLLCGCGGPPVELGAIVDCQNKPISKALLDLEFKDSYTLNLRVYFSGNTSSSFRITEGILWFEYPANFSLSGGGSALYPKSAPKKLPLTSFFSTRDTKQKVGDNPELFRVEFPSETGSLWQHAIELKAAFYQFDVVVHLTLSGQHNNEAPFELETLKFPMTVCRGCFKKSIAQCKEISKNSLCQGQDGYCQ